MHEGLVLLDEKGAVLSINPAAQTLFGVTGALRRAGFPDRGPRALELSLALAHGDDRRAQRDCAPSAAAREYQFDLSRIESDGKVVGAVLLAFDMTDAGASPSAAAASSPRTSHTS